MIPHYWFHYITLSFSSMATLKLGIFIQMYIPISVHTFPTTNIFDSDYLRRQKRLDNLCLFRVATY